ncbi:MAG: hypothetical protein WDO14_13855 [Bacteroidota bacterium]
MRVIVMLVLAGLTCSAFGQQGTVVVDPKRNYTVKSEGEIYNGFDREYPEYADTTTADLNFNNSDWINIHFAKANFAGDTLQILVYETNPAFHHQYRISIIDNKFFIYYEFRTSGENVKRIARTLESKLILNTLDFKKGKEIRGYTEYKGECIDDCWSEPISIRGNFKVIIPGPPIR